MSEQAESAVRPLRVAVIGSGPAGFYTADFILKSKAINGHVDMFERLPCPFGLVRSGVAPDHQSIKKVSKAFERIAAHERFRFFGNVEVGKDILHEDLMKNYHQVVYATGSPTDRRLNIDGEDLGGSHAATAFVGWYNGHPDFRNETFDLSCPRAIVVGLGNVAMDVARILMKDPKELEDSDMASYALDALKQSKLREVVLLGRRGAAQAAFTPREIMDIAELSGVELFIDGPAIDPPTDDLTGDAKKNVEFLHEVSKRTPGETPRRVRLKLLCSPVEIVGESGKMNAVRIEHNKLVDSGGRLSARGTGEFETIEAGLIFRSIGYFGTPLASVPFDEKKGTIPNEKGQVTDGPGGPPVVGLYTVGWIKRGPSGLIGTNKSDAKDTTDTMLAKAPGLAERELPPASTIDELLASRKVRPITIADWRVIDELELANGKKVGKVREKFYGSLEMLEALDGARG